jgi:excisionase family DNA binding protein
MIVATATIYITHDAMQQVQNPCFRAWCASWLAPRLAAMRRGVRHPTGHRKQQPMRAAAILARKPMSPKRAVAPTWPAREDRPDGAVAAANGPHAASKRIPTDAYLTVAEAADLLRVCTKTVRNRIRGCELEAYRHGRRVLIPRRAIEHLIKRGRV